MSQNEHGVEGNSAVDASIAMSKTSAPHFVTSLLSAFSFYSETSK